MIPASAFRVMIVDDKSMMRSLTHRALEHLGFRQIFAAASAIEALPLARSNRVHLIISDYNMPLMNGLQFLETVRKDEVLGKCAFIMLSGSGNGETMRQAAALGANSYIIKPFAMAELRQRVDQALSSVTGTRTEMRALQS